MFSVSKQRSSRRFALVRSVLGRQKGLSHAVQLAAKEGSTEEVPTGIIVDVEEGRCVSNAYLTVCIDLCQMISFYD